MKSLLTTFNPVDRGWPDARNDGQTRCAALVSSPIMATVAGNGVALHYERGGREDGPRLLFCNGSGTTVGSSRPLLDMLSEIAAFLGA